MRLGKALDKLAAKYPALAIRKVEVPQYESPVAEAHGITGLPVLWLYNRSGKRVEVIGKGTNAELLARIESLLAP